MRKTQYCIVLKDDYAITFLAQLRWDRIFIWSIFRSFVPLFLGRSLEYVRVIWPGHMWCQWKSLCVVKHCINKHVQVSGWFQASVLLLTLLV